MTIKNVYSIINRINKREVRNIKEKILSVLEKNKGEYVSGESLGQILEISRTAIWKNINSLKKEGYKIYSKTNKGYMLSSDSDIITEEKIRRYLDTKILGQKINIYKSADSTNNQMRQQAYNKEKEGTVIISDEQVNGKGRYSRSFYSPKGNGIYMSLLLRPKISIYNINLVTILTAVSVVEAIKEVCNINTSIKWVNDILYDNKKLCGILTEASIEGESGQVDFIVVGIGININSTTDFPKAFNKMSIALNEISDVRISRSMLIGEIINKFEKYYLHYINGSSPDNILNSYRTKLCMLGKEVYILKGDCRYKALAVDISNEGRLIINDNGEIRELSSGEISLCI